MLLFFALADKETIITRAAKKFFFVLSLCISKAAFPSRSFV